MIFSLRQLQGKYREQRRPLYLGFIDLTKAFDMVSRSGLFALLQRIGCPPKLLKLIIAFHEDMQRNGASFKSFPIVSGVKQVCVLVLTLFGIFSLLLSYPFQETEDGIYLHTRNDGEIFNLPRLRSKTMTLIVLFREMLFADDAALAAPSEQTLQGLVDRLSLACDDFGLETSLKNTQIMSRDISSIPNICIRDYMLEVVENLVYLGTNINNNLALKNEINSKIGKASSTMARLAKSLKKFSSRHFIRDGCI